MVPYVVWSSRSMRAVDSVGVGLPNVQQSSDRGAALTGSAGAVYGPVEVDAIVGCTVRADVGHFRALRPEWGVGLVVGSLNVFGGGWTVIVWNINFLGKVKFKRSCCALVQWLITVPSSAADTTMSPTRQKRAKKAISRPILTEIFFTDAWVKEILRLKDAHAVSCEKDYCHIYMYNRNHKQRRNGWVTSDYTVSRFLTGEQQSLVQLAITGKITRKKLITMWTDYYECTMNSAKCVMRLFSVRSLIRRYRNNH